MSGSADDDPNEMPTLPPDLQATLDRAASSLVDSLSTALADPWTQSQLGNCSMLALSTLPPLITKVFMMYISDKG